VVPLLKGVFRGEKGSSQNFRYPSAELRDQVRAAVRERGFRSEQIFLIADCEPEIRQGTNTAATEQFKARVAATLTNLAKQVQGLQTLAHAQVALTDVFLKFVITAWSNPRRLRQGQACQSNYDAWVNCLSCAIPVSKEEFVDVAQ
jgi:hypothetical protein